MKSRLSGVRPWLAAAILLIVVIGLESPVEASGSFNDFDQTTISPLEKAKYFSDKKIGVGADEEQCSERVYEFRKRVQENGGPTLGVEPTVGLGAALLIFLLVGTFAAGIAQAFQMVRTRTYKTLVSWSVFFFCAHHKKLKGAKTQENGNLRKNSNSRKDIHFLAKRKKTVRKSA